LHRLRRLPHLLRHKVWVVIVLRATGPDVGRARLVGGVRLLRGVGRRVPLLLSVQSDLRVAPAAQVLAA